MGPIYNRIHLGFGISPELPWQNDSVANSLFSGPFFDPKKVPGPECWPWIPKSNPRLKNLPPGMKKLTMRAEKPCRIQSSEFQTEPYSASDGQKQFWRVPAQMGPMDNRIHLGLGISPELPWQNHSITTSLLGEPFFEPQKVPGPKYRPEIKKSDPGL